MAPGAAGDQDVRVPRLHPDELPIDDGLVRRLIDRSFPDLAGRDLRRLDDSGSSNVLFRLGDDLLVRLPRQPGGGATIEKEARWLPVVDGHLGVAVPCVLGVGEAAPGYPERWSITTWLDGTRPTASFADTGDRAAALAQDLARFVTELRSMPVPDRAEDDDTLSWYRGEKLATLDAYFRVAAEECRSLGVDLDVDQALRVWDRAAEASLATEHATGWYHGDLLVENLLLDDEGRLAAVLDFGGLAHGDPTVDLVVAWEALSEDGRRDFRRALDVEEDTWTVSRGWALSIALMTFPYYGTTMPRRCADRLRMARAAMSV